MDFESDEKIYCGDEKHIYIIYNIIYIYIYK